jgi:DNA uptake protein ComE-like DNA-binding protein
VRRGIPDLKSREWVAVFILLAGFLFLSKGAFQAPNGRWPMAKGEPIEKPSSLIVIRVQGAVQKPGVYQFRAGTKIAEVLQACEVKDEANLTKIDMEQPVKKGQKLTVKARSVKNRAK